MSEIPAARFTVKVPNIDPAVPEVCCACLSPEAPARRRLVFRRSDGAVERVCAVHWAYCPACLSQLRRLDRLQRGMTLCGLAQMLIVIYAVGAALDMYDLWAPALGGLALFFALFIHFARGARALWGLEWARIDDVYKGGIGAAFSFRRRDYAQLFAQANGGAALLTPSAAAPTADADATGPAATARAATARD